MRVLFCKIHCPSFICFCKPSIHFYSPGTLKLENGTPHVPGTKPVSGTDLSHNDHHVQVSGNRNETVKGKEENAVDHEAGEKCRKSSLRKADSGGKELRKRVQWMDATGKELAEIKEFESSDREDTEYEENGSRSCVSCVCVIL